MKDNNSFIESSEYKNALIKEYDFKDLSSNNYFDFYYSVSNVDSNLYIPEPLYLLFIEKVLNQREFSAVLSDKNYYEAAIDDIKTPKTLLRKINGHYYDKDYNRVALSTKLLDSYHNHEKIVLKASLFNSSGAGKNIIFFYWNNNNFYNVKDNEILRIADLDSYPDFIIQEAVKQHEFYKKFNPDSNNTIRVLTYRSVKNDSVVVLHRLLRVGKKGVFLDHDNLGGSVIGINSNGIINPFCSNSDGLTYD
ncbi:MAG: sugar-transfer associated ATP-grasp domain-containing protein, partial [bacterium]